MEKYSKTKEKYMKQLYARLPEDRKKMYAALEAIMLGPGGEQYIAALFGCDLETISKGKKELEKL